MDERLAFGCGTSAGGREVRAQPGPDGASMDAAAIAPPLPALSAAQPRRDWAFVGLMTFTALLFFRPQDQIPGLGALHLAELSALAALAAMVMGRVRRGLSVSRLTPELGGVVALGAVILLTAPFSIWPGGAVGTFTDVYSKIILIFVLMVNTLTTPKRVDQFIWLIVLASGYLAFRAVLDYARGFNLVENGRVQGAVGGMFKNPNDLALNMVAVMPLAASLAIRSAAMVRRMTAGLAALLMAGAIVASESRSGTIGLVVMTLIMGVYVVRRKPAIAFAGALALLLAVPLLPGSYWHRLSSITDQSQDDTGSREARRILLQESFTAFLQHPLTGVGAGQFKNYDPEGREQAWRESHNVVLQVAAELGIAGVAILFFLVIRAASAGMQTRRLLRRAFGTTQRASARPRDPGVLTADAEWVHTHSAAMAAALAGWFVCALFASVAYNWTFYYLVALAVAPRDILADRLAAMRPRKAKAPVGTRLQEARA